MAKVQLGVSLTFFCHLSLSFALMISLCCFPVMSPRFDHLLVSYVNFEGRNLETMILNTAVPLMAMLLLLTVSAVSMTPNDSACACLRTCFFRSNCFPMICVLCQINLGRHLAKEAVLAPTLAGRRYYAVGAVACFVELALKLCMIMVLCPADGV
ncbi:hypothetical protein VPH35_036080 [Triticum aestivum]|uniref:uncharacterized protein n=1 Tax=Triticum aestivum TaxID=4565 RepID=UPI001ABC569C|nr:uncharacterized protein LOC123052223 [Triticum aestivum]